ncbi:MAG TPA: aromatic ring-hydroxylating dioxygenase subunit alpha [Actinomycetota bacterium]|nr:aromatic ring-hydroxylating dioxygenase subunit alpha [Actinomycetota bacterium]
MLGEAQRPTTGRPTYPGLTAAQYTDPEIFELERERIFDRQWFCVGRSEELPEPGSFVQRDVPGDSLLLTRDLDGRVHAFYNVCRHRGSVLVEEERGQVRKAFTCPYHAWVYGLDGRLLGTPNVRADDGLDRDAYGLRGIGVEEWEGYLFVSHASAGERPDLLGNLAREPDEPLSYGRFRIGQLRLGHRVTYEVEANWKIVWENYNECLHCPGVHPELSQMVPLFRRGLVADDDDPTVLATLADGWEAFTLSGTTSLPHLPGLDPIDARTYYGAGIFPNLMINMRATGVTSFTLYPRAVDHTTVVSDYLYRPETIASDSFDPSEMIEFLDLVARQDWEICALAQRGATSKGFDRSVYPPQERYVHLFAERYREELRR